MKDRLIVCFRTVNEVDDYRLPFVLKGKDDDIFEYVYSINVGELAVCWFERKSLFKTLIKVSV